MSSSPYVVDVGASNFESEVLDRSRDVPVVVDFWAPWCGPCRTLGPVMEKLADRDDGRWILAKVNTEENQDLARQFRIQGIPNVKAFVDGEVVDEFSGALPEYAVDNWLQALMPSESDIAMEPARRAEDEGRLEDARNAYEAILQADSEHAEARAGLVRVLLASDDADAARAQIDATPEHLWRSTDGALERAWIAVEAADAPGEDERRAALADDENDHQARFELGMTLAEREEWDAALEQLLEIVARDRSWRDDLGREAMVRVFEALGSDSDLANAWRSKMGAVMYV